MKKRLLINRTGRMRYISHLEFIYFLERFMKRIKIKIQYSEGFHPRPKFVFGNPVSLGMESYNEPIDMTIVNDISNCDLKEAINRYAPLGFTVVDVLDLSEKESINKDFNCIEYDIVSDMESLEKIKTFVSGNTVVIRKEKEGKVTEAEVKDKIKKVFLEGEKLKIWLNEISPKFILRTLGVELKCTITRMGYGNII